MPDFIAFAAGENSMLEAGQGSPIKAGMPSAAVFALSTYAVSDFISHLGTAVTSAASIAEMSASWYVRASMVAPTPSGGNLQYGTGTWASTDTSGTLVKSVVLLSTPSLGTGASGIPYCAWNLQAGGTPVDMSQNNTTLTVTPLLTTGS